MEKKSIVFYSLVGLVAVGVLVGTVLFLRARSQPAGIAENLSVTTISTTTQGAGNTPAAQPNTQPVRPYTPPEKTPHAKPWKPGDPLVPQPTTTLIMTTVNGKTQLLNK